MNRIILVSVAVSLLATHALAAGMPACDEANIEKTEHMAMGMKADDQKDAMMAAMQEIDGARMAMKEGKMDDCSTHLDKAMGAMGMH